MEIIHTKHDSFFPQTMKIIGVILCLTLIGIPLGVFILFTEQGASFKPSEKLYRHYVGLWGLRLGKWQSYENYPDLAILSQRMTTISFSESNRQTNQSEVVHEMYLLTADHRRKILAFVFKNKQALDDANPEEIASMLGVSFAQYSPEISAQTRARRR